MLRFERIFENLPLVFLENFDSFAASKACPVKYVR